MLFFHTQMTSLICSKNVGLQPVRYGSDCASDVKRNKTKFLSGIKTRNKRRKLCSPLSVTALANNQNSSPSGIYQKVLLDAREKFTREISFQAMDKDISLAKALLYIAVEDEALMAINREIDARSFKNEREDSVSTDSFDWDCMEDMPFAGKNIDGWIAELDVIAKDVEAELVSRDIGCHLVEVLDAVNAVLFDSLGFKRSSLLLDPNCSYLHLVLSSRCCSAILLSVIYIEICQRLNLHIVGSRFGENFLIWPETENPEELFKVTSGHSLFGIVNGTCVDDPRSKASDLNSSSLLGLEIASNRDIIGIALANLIRVHWKCASRRHPGLMLTSPLRPVYDNSSVPLLQPLHLRLAIMAAERLLILQPHNWSLRRDLGMMLYYSRDYVEAVQELSICMVFAPEEDVRVLEQFVEKLHLLRLEASWISMGRKGPLTVP